MRTLERDEGGLSPVMRMIVLAVVAITALTLLTWLIAGMLGFTIGAGLVFLIDPDRFWRMVAATALAICGIAVLVLRPVEGMLHNLFLAALPFAGAAAVYFEVI